MKPLGIAVIGMALVLSLVGIAQILQQATVGQIVQCQAAIVDQFVASSGPRAAAADVKDRAEADMASALIDPEASDAEKKRLFTVWVEAVEDLVRVKAENPLPPPPTDTCGEVQ